MSTMPKEFFYICSMLKCCLSKENIVRPTTCMYYDLKVRVQSVQLPFFHHYQGSIDFNTVNVNRTVGMYFLVSTGNRDDIE